MEIVEAQLSISRIKCTRTSAKTHSLNMHAKSIAFSAHVESLLRVLHPMFAKVWSVAITESKDAPVLFPPLMSPTSYSTDTQMRYWRYPAFLFEMLWALLRTQNLYARQKVSKSVQQEFPTTYGLWCVQYIQRCPAQRCFGHLYVLDTSRYMCFLF